MPRVLASKQTLEELLDKNYTPKYVPPRIYKEMRHRITSVSQSQKIYGVQKRLFDSIKPESLQKGAVAMATMLDFYTKDPKPMTMMSNEMLTGWLPAMTEVTSRNFYICDEQLIRLPLYIYFETMPNSDVAFETYKQLTEAGIVSYWQAVEKINDDGLAALVAKDDAKAEGIWRPAKPIEGTLLDSLVLESFYVFLHGVTCATVALVVECTLEFELV